MHGDLSGFATVLQTVLTRRYKAVLRAAAAHINRVHGSANGALVLNLGPAWLSGEAYSLFSNNVIEIPFKDWESPPGLGICPLGVIFTVCSSIASWLALNEDHVVVGIQSPFNMETFLCSILHNLCSKAGSGLCGDKIGKRRHSRMQQDRRWGGTKG